MLVQLLIQIEKNSELVCAARECFVIARASKREIRCEMICMQLYSPDAAARRSGDGRRRYVQSEFSCGGFWLLLITRCSIYTSFAQTDWLARARPECIWASATLKDRWSLSFRSRIKCIVRAAWNMKESRGACAHFDFKTVRGQDERHSQQPRGTWPLLALMKLDENEFFVPLSSCAIWRFWINQMCVIKKSLMWKFLAYRSGLGKTLVK